MTKKIISVLLAAVMLITGLITTAFANDAKTTNDVKALIEAFDGDMTAAEPEDSVIKKYNEAVDAFNALPESERNSFDATVFGKLLCKVYDREIVRWKEENNSTSNSNASKAAHERAKSVLKMPAYVDEAYALASDANKITKEAQALELIEKLKTSSINAIILAGGFYNPYKLFSNASKTASGSKLIDLIANKLSSATQKADAANKPSSPKYVSKPILSKFEGEDDPKYIEAYKKYLSYKEANADYYVARYEFEGEKHYFAALEKTVAAVPAFKYVYDLAVSSIAAKREFNKTNDTAAVKSAATLYNSLTEQQKTWLDSFGNSVFAEKVINTETPFGPEYNYKYYKITGLAEFCVSMEFYGKLTEFEETVAAVTEPYTNDDIAAVKAAYNAIPASLQSSVSADTMTKYRSILASVTPDKSSDEKPDLSSYAVSQTPETYLTEKYAETLADTTVELILNAAGASDAYSLIYSGVFTNGTVLSLAKWLYPMIGNLTSLLSCAPEKLAKSLTEEKFAGAAAALTAAGEDWEAVEIKNGDFGFKDGNVEGFLDAVSAMLRGASLIHVALKLQNITDTAKGEYNYGAYEDLIPIFEILDLKSVMSSVEYTEYVNKAENANDAKFRAILTPIAYLLVDFANDPVNTVADILPKLAYAIDTGIVDTGVNGLLAKLTMVSVDPVDLTTAGVYKILNDNLLTPNNVVLPEDEFTEAIKLLAGCGTAVVKPSVRRGFNYRLGIDPDKSKTIVVFMNWLIEFAKENKDSAKTIIDAAFKKDKLTGAALKIAVGITPSFMPQNITFTFVVTVINFAHFIGRVKSIFGRVPTC